MSIGLLRTCECRGKIEIFKYVEVSSGYGEIVERYSNFYKVAENVQKIR